VLHPNALVETPAPYVPSAQLTMLDAAVRAKFDLSWGKARAYVEHGKVRVDGVVCMQTTRFVRPGSVLELNLAAPRPRPDRDLAPDVFVYQDAHVVVLNKPAGISTLPFDESETGTLHERVQYALSRGRAGEKAQPVPLGVVHRIDKETSGLLVMTRTWLAKQSLTSQFREHTVHRLYLALVHGRALSTTYQTHILDDRGDGLRGSYEARPRKGPREGQLAITHMTVLETFANASLVQCRLETGRTHQIRIHLAEAGMPLLGERVYSRGYRGELLPSPRMMLHAAELGFIHPKTEELVEFAQPLPADMAEMLEWLRGQTVHAPPK
jgi:23S rRNA pseudouridine1911/1915/1917 synthase